MDAETKQGLKAPAARPSAITERNASKRELIATIMHLRLVGARLAQFIEEQMPLFMGVSSEFDGAGEPKALLRLWKRADRAADKSYGPADVDASGNASPLKSEATDEE